MKAAALTLFAITLYVLHQDYWNWTDKTLLFGFLPMGLAYHAVFSIACAVMMLLLVKFAWPTELENVAEHNPEKPS